MPEASTARALICPGCGAEYDLGPHWFGCVHCSDAAGNPHWLDVSYDTEAADRDAVARAGRLWEYASLLPVRDPLHAPTLGEGGTPLLRIDVLNAELGLPNLYLKVETVNPTGSFKDRLHAVGIGVAREFGYARAAIVTTGNSGVACAAMCARAGIDLLVITDPLSSPEQRRLMRLFGARITVPTKPGPVIVHAQALMEELVRRHNFYPCTVQGPYAGVGNPYGVEGYKTIAYEVAAQLGRAPDRMCVPTAGGDALYGPYRGFRDLLALGLIDALPKMTACQAEGANFAVRAVREGRDSFEALEPKTVALSIADPLGSGSILAAIRGSDGDAWDATDDELLDVVALLGRHGLCVEAASAAPVAAARKQAAAGVFDRNETIVAVLTGSGMKWPAQVDDAIGDVELLPDDAGAIIAAMEAGR